MLNWLKSILQVEPAPQKTMELQAKLLPTNGAHLFGEAEFETYDNDGWELEAEVDFRNGERPTPLIMYLKGKPVLNLAPDHDESEGKLSSRRGDILGVTPLEGMPIEIKMAGETVLSGKFERHPRFQ
ncbi:MAG: hypothetical protein AAF331_11915 [Pseudomonadota bacterium]